MKKIFISLLLISLIMLNTITLYADVVEYKVPITLTAATKNFEGKEQKNFLQRDDINLEYTITPQDISLGNISSNKPIDIVLVLDTSGSMNEKDNNGRNTPTRLENAKIAMRSFIEKMSKVKNSDSISVSIVTFDYSAQTAMEFKSVSKEKAQILQAINNIRAEGSTNGGDGLRLAYRNLSTNRPVGAEKYVLYLGDGENNVLTYSKDNTKSKVQYVYKFGSNKIWLNKKYTNTLENFTYSSYDNIKGYKYVNKNDNSTMYVEQDGAIYYYDYYWKRYYVYSTLSHYEYSTIEYNDYYLGDNEYKSNTDKNGVRITDQFNNYGSLGSLEPLDYAKTVASTLLAKNGVTTFVVGVGDNNSENQMYQNKEICKSANNTDFINDYYSAVDDSKKLEELYGKIGDKILDSVLVKDIQLKVDFPRNIQYKGNKDDLLNILDISINNVSIQNPEKIIIKDNSIYISIDEFEYTYNPIDKAYKAKPINLNIKMNIPEKCATGKVDMVSTNLSYRALGLNLNTLAPSISFNIIEGVKPVSISSILEIFKDGSAKLTFVPSDNVSTVNIKISAEAESSFKQYYNLEKNKEYSLNLTAEELNAFLEGKIYIETVNKVNNKDIKGLDEVSIIKFSEVVNEKINSISDTHRLSVLKLIGEQNLADFNFIVNGKPVDNIAPIYKDGVHSKELELKHGKNEILVSPKNSYGHITKLYIDVDVCATRPKLSSMNMSPEKIDIIISDDSCKLKSAIIKLYDNEGNLVKEFKELNINTSSNPNKKNFSFNFEGIDVSRYKLEIEVIDVHNNALIVEDSGSTIIENGIYLRAKNKFYTGAIVPNYRYQFAIKFVVTKPMDLVIDVNALLAEGVVLQPGEDISLDLKNSKLYLIADNKVKNLSEQFKMLDNKKAIYKIDEVESGKEYLLVFDFKLKSSSNKVKNINIKVSLGHVYNNLSIPVVAEPKVD